MGTARESFLTGIVDIVKEMISLDLQTEKRVQFYYYDMFIIYILLIHKSLISLVDNLNGDDSESKGFCSSQLSNVEFTTETMTELCSLLMSIVEHLKSAANTALLYPSMLYTSTKMYLEELNDVLVDHRRVHNGDFIVILSSQCTIISQQ